MEKAEFAEKTSPESLTGRLRQAQIASYLAQAGSANRPQYQQIGVDANGNAVVVDMRNPSNTRTRFAPLEKFRRLLTFPA
jgi:hypothetical protein